MDIWWTPGGHLKDICVVVMDGVVVMDTSSTSVVVMDDTWWTTPGEMKNGMKGKNGIK